MLRRIMLKMDVETPHASPIELLKWRIMVDITNYEVFVGFDVGKSSSYVVVLDKSGNTKLISQPVEQNETSIKAVLSKVAREGKALVVVDQVGNIGRLVVATAQSMGFDVAHIPPRSFKKIAETYGEGKSDAKDAYIIADVARSSPRLINPIGNRHELLDEVKVLISYRDDLIRERTRYYNRLHDLIQQVCPPLEALFGKQALHTAFALELFSRYGGPQGLRRAGKSRVGRWIDTQKYQRVTSSTRTDEIFSAVHSMTVFLPATSVIEDRIKEMSARIVSLERDAVIVDKMIGDRAAFIPEVEILKSIPGIGLIYGVTIATEISSIERFPSANHLASYGGVAPRKETSGTSVNKNKKARGGNRRLKNAFIQSAQRAVDCDRHCREYYEKKRAEGKKHKSALRSLARRRVEVIYALLATGSFYEPLPVTK